MRELIDDDLERLVDAVGSGTRPVFIEVTPEPYARVNECFPAVAEKVRQDGGKAQLGWQLWRGRFLLEAEFHAVWRSPKSDLRDITPKSVPVGRILFLPDPRARYEGRQVDSVRLNRTTNQLVDDLVAVHEALFRLGNAGERATQNAVVLEGPDAEHFGHLQEMLAGIISILNGGGTRNSPCFCRSRRRYRLCHGEDLCSRLARTR